MSAVDLNEKLLIEAGGWQALKHAKALLSTGRVISANYAPPVLTGLVREGDTDLRAGLIITSKSHIDNLCGCADARRRGIICAHSLAVGLALLQVRKPEAPPASQPQKPTPVGPTFSTTGTGQRVSLHLVLAPKLNEAWARNQIMVGAEVDRGGRRALLSSLRAGESFACELRDMAVIEKLRDHLNEGTLPGMAILQRDQFLALLGVLKGHPRITLGRKQPAAVSSAPLRPRLKLSVSADGGMRLKADTTGEGSLLLGRESAWVLAHGQFAQIAPGLPAAYLPVLGEGITLLPAEAAAFLTRELPQLRSFLDVEDSAATKGGADGAAAVEPGAPQFALSLDGSLNQLVSRLQAIYGSRIVTLGVTSAAETFTYRDVENAGCLLTRNLPAEAVASARLASAGFRGPNSQGQFTLTGEKQTLTFFAQKLGRLEREWKVDIGGRFQHVTKDIERISPKLEIRASGEDWFQLDFTLQTGSGERFSSSEIQRLLQMGQSHVRLENGRRAVFDSAFLDEFQSILAECEPEQARPGEYRIDRRHAGFLQSALGEQVEIDAPAAWREWAGAQSRHEAMTPVPLGALEETLRPYQKQGVYWMHFLARNGFGGVLADEMGLGKTLQALTYLATSERKLPTLVVCPSSLIYNWAREAAAFTPHLRCLPIVGVSRGKSFEGIGSADLVITSYPLLRRDIDRYRSMRFETVILDEAQHVKNPDTQNARAAMALRADAKFVLTGTPVENSPRDLWSLMEFLMPGYLGSREDFKERYENPIQNDASPEAQKRLGHRIRPFLLRRTKKEFLKELPDKIEQVVFCELKIEQREVYTKLLRGAQRQIADAESVKASGQARMMMLTALLRLRQTCCDLRLLGLPDADAAPPSAKAEAFEELLSEIIDGGHRVLVFSQFVSMLTLLREQLDSSGVRYCYLDGQTKDRGSEVDRFQATPGIPVFLISLKAGGVGLNLTEADTVIHFDPWWNPAVEAQATDRAHRIGQRKVVTSYKLIARDTVEEKILNLQRRKREVIDATIESEEPLMTSLTMDDIRTLLD